MKKYFIVGVEIPKGITITQVTDHIRAAVRTKRSRGRNYAPDILETPIRRHSVTVSPHNLTEKEKELRLLQEYTGYVALSADDEFQPLDYDSWKEDHNNS